MLGISARGPWVGQTAGGVPRAGVRQPYPIASVRLLLPHRFRFGPRLRSFKLGVGPLALSSHADCARERRRSGCLSMAESARPRCA